MFVSKFIATRVISAAKPNTTQLQRILHFSTINVNNNYALIGAEFDRQRRRQGQHQHLLYLDGCHQIKSQYMVNLQHLRCYSMFSNNNHANIVQRTQQQQQQLQQQQRSISTHEITKNLQLVCETTRCTERDVNTLRLGTPLDKPLVILLSWLMSKPKHINKYAQLYTDQGFDVLTVTVTPWQVIWPTKGTQLVAADVVKFLANNITKNPVVLHGFSVGGYVWGECMVHMARDMDLFRNVLDRICGQVWDSAVELSEIPLGVPKAMFPKNDTLQRALANYMIYHMKTFHEPATSHYIRSSQMFHSTLVKKPALFFLSKSDPIGSVSSNRVLRQSWESLGISCEWQCWDKSPHVGHFQKHRDEYIGKLYDFLQSLNMIQCAEKIQVRI